jgi:hypothetical protein
MPQPWQDNPLQLQRLNTSLGSVVNFPGVLQDSYTSEFLIFIEGTIGTAAATAAIEGLSLLAQRVTINGPLAGYNPLNPINNVSGSMLTEYAQFKRNNVSYSFGSLGSTGKFSVCIPCTFINPRLRYPFSHMTVLPTKWMGAVNFNVQISSQAQLDTNGTPTLAFSTLTIYVQQNEYKASSIPPLATLGQAIPSNAFLLQFIPSTLNYYSFSSITTTGGQQQLFPNGTYLGLLIRSFQTTVNGSGTVRQADTSVNGPLDTSVTTSGIILQDVNQSPKVSSNFYAIRSDNLNNIYDSLVTGNACLQFNRSLSKIFQTTVGPNQIPLVFGTTTTGTSTPRIDFVYEQIFDSQNWLGLV